MMVENIMLLIIGFSFLSLGGELFIRGSRDIAYLLRIRPLTIGLVIAAFATTTPEFSVSLIAAVRRSSDLAIGNIVGSCIANIGLVLGLASLIRPIKIEESLLKKEIPMLISSSLLLFLLASNLYIGRLDGALLLLGFILFIGYCIFNARRRGDPEKRSRSPVKTRALFFLFAGIGLLLVGAHLIVNGAITIARHLGISPLTIGLTMVALGTSLPELAISVTSSIKGEADIGIGNIIGANIFNLLLVAGVVSLIQPITIPQATIGFELPLAVIFSLALLPLLKSGLRISRLEGLALVASYAVYIFILFKRGV